MNAFFKPSLGKILLSIPVIFIFVIIYWFANANFVCMGFCEPEISTYRILVPDSFYGSGGFIDFVIIISSILDYSIIAVLGYIASRCLAWLNAKWWGKI